MKNTTLPALTIAALSVVLLAGADWPRFLGPDGSGVSGEKDLPTTWSATENIVWKTALPGFGASSPITVGERIFVTAYSGYAQGDDKAGQPEDLRHHVVCLDRATGNILWDKSTKAIMPEQPYGGFIALHGYASGTPASDGKAVYAFFGRSGVYAYSLAGDLLWHAEVGTKTHEWGSGTSPILAGDLVIVNASVESQSVVALKKANGENAWQTEGIRESWSTPALLQLAGGRQELVVSCNGKVLGLDPATGKQLWTCAGVPDYVCPSVLAHGDVAYVTGGRKSVALAVRGGGEGDVTKSHKLWQSSKAPKVPTPLCDGGNLYWVSDSGIACCVKADTGEVAYEQRISGLGVVYGSLLLADGKLYCTSRQKGTVLLAAGPDFKELARNNLGDSSVFNATPVPCGNGRLLLRSDKYLYCVGK
jgi:outer membrane protein assembly factor BamB